MGAMSRQFKNRLQKSEKPSRPTLMLRVSKSEIRQKNLTRKVNFVARKSQRPKHDAQFVNALLTIKFLQENKR